MAHATINHTPTITPHPFHLLSPPQGFEPDVATVDAANAAGLSTVEVTNDPIEGVRNADVIYTDVWASMQEKDQAAKREAIFRPYQV